MTVDPAVRSVRVAVALCDRFTELLKGPQTVSARKQSGALLGVSGNEGEMSLRIGEAQQLYPEIWRHLDDARAAFATRGIDLAGYDAIRKAEGQALGADVEVEHSRRGYGKHAIEEHVKSANFNRAGLARAREAVESLVRATPQIDWAAVARAEEDPAVAAFARAARTRRWLLLGLLLLVIASPFLYVIHLHNKERDDQTARNEAYDRSHAPVEVLPMGDQEHAALARTVAQLRDALAAARKAWPLAVAKDALAKIVPGTGPCALAFAAPPAAAIDAYIRDGNGDGLGASFASYTAGEAIGDDQLAAASTIVDGIDRRLTANRANDADGKRLARLDPQVVFFIVDSETPPEITATAPSVVYTPGKVLGRAFVFDMRSARIVCAAAVDARNAPADPPVYFELVGRMPAPRKRQAAGEVLHRELEIRIRQALASGLHATP